VNSGPGDNMHYIFKKYFLIKNILKYFLLWYKGNISLAFTIMDVIYNIVFLLSSIKNTININKI